MKTGKESKRESCIGERTKWKTEAWSRARRDDEIAILAFFGKMAVVLEKAERRGWSHDG